METRPMFCLIVGMALLGMLIAAPGVRAEGPDGKEAFLAQKCNLCHGVEGAQIEAKTKSEKLYGGDLTRVAEERDAEWIAGYIRQEIQKDGEDHKREFTGTEEELQGLLEWFQSLANPAGEG